MTMIKTAISIPETMFDEVNEAAREKDVSRSGLVVLALGEYLRRRESARMLAQLNAVYGDEEDLDDDDKALLAMGMRSMYELLKDDEW